MIYQKNSPCGCNRNKANRNSSYSSKHSHKPPYKQGKSFAEINALALGSLTALLHRWLPDGVIQGHEYVALNPTRLDRKRGSFRINIHTGRWSDFATGDKGGDVISLAAYLFGLSQIEAKNQISNMLGA